MGTMTFSLISLLILLKIGSLSAVGFEDRKYCSSVTLYGNKLNDANYAELAECNVIEGHLRIHRTKMHEGASLRNLTEITDYLILERVGNLHNLASFFSGLVIKGQNLFLDKYALVLIGNMQLTSFTSNDKSSIGAIQAGAVYIEDNILYCVDEDHYSKLTSMVYSDANFFNNNMQFCPFIGCEEQGYCEAAEKTCNTLGRPCPVENDKDCHNQCIGGCYKARDANSCVACKNFVYNKTCFEKCPLSTLLYMNYRCISYAECMNNNYTVLYPEDTTFLDDGTTSEDAFPELNSYRKNRDKVKCVKRCPEKFIVHLGGVRRCRLKRVCETTTLTHLNLGKNLRYCTHIEGNLIIIMITGGKNVSESLESNLGMIQTVSGYIKVAGASILYSLSFLRNLKSIEGKEKFLEKYALYITENENLVELFPLKDLKINGSVYIKHNDRLCDDQIATLKKVANISEERISNGSNGKHGKCEKFKTHLQAVPGNNGSILLQWFHIHCGVYARTVVGYSILYRISDENLLSKYHGRDACNDVNNNNKVWSKVNVELEVLKTAKCLSYELACLRPNTRYAIYIESLTLYKKVVESDIVFVRTYNDIPETPKKGGIKLRDKGFVLSYEQPRLHSYFNSSELFYEIDVKIEDDRISDEDEDDEAEDIEVRENSSNGHFCPCPPKEPSNTYLLENERQSIEIANEIRKLRYYRIIDPKPSPRNKRSVHSTTESSESTSGKRTCGTLQSKSAREKFFDYSNEKEAFKKTCEAGQANAQACEEPSVDYSSLATKFKRTIVPSLIDKDNILKISENSSKTSIFLRLPTDYQLNTKPRRIRAKVRSCVGKMEKCYPLKINESCAICSEFLSLTTHTVPNLVPKIDVKPYRTLSKPEKSHFQYISCNEPDLSPVYVDKTWDEILEKARKGSSKREDASNLEFLNVTWTDPSSVSYDGYRIFYRRMDVEMKETTSLFINKTEAEKRAYHVSIPIDPTLQAKTFLIGVEIKFKGGYGRSNIKCVSIPWNESTDLLVYFVVAIVAALATLTLVALYKISRGMFSIVKKKITYINSNNCYNAQFSGINEKFLISPGKISMKNIEKNKNIIGKGNFSNVYKSYIYKENAGSVPVAVKTMKPNEAAGIIKREIKIMQDFHCAFLVHLIAVSYKMNTVGEPELLIVLPHLFKDLKSYLKEETEEPLENEAIYQVCAQIAAALEYLHEKGIVHGDLAARNILIEELCEEGPVCMVVKLGDFGLARQFKGSHYEEHDIPPESAPEYKNNKYPISCSSDMYSFGVLITVLFFHNRHEHCGDANIVQLITKGKLSISGCESKSLSDLQKNTLKNNPKRYPASRVIEELLPQTSLEFQGWFNDRMSSTSNSKSTELDGGFPSSLCTTRSLKTDSESTEPDEGCPSSSLDASQDYNDLSSATSRTGHWQESMNGPYDDMVHLTPKDGGRNRASRLGFGSLSCGKKNNSDDDDD